MTQKAVNEQTLLITRLQGPRFRPRLKAVAAVVCVAFTLTQLELGWAEIFSPRQDAARASHLAPASKLQDHGLHQAFLAKAHGPRVKKPFRLSLSTVLLVPTTIWVAVVAVLSFLKLYYPALVPSIVFQHVPYPYSAFKIVAGWTSIMLGIGLILKWVNSHRFSWGRLVGFCLAGFLSFDSYIPIRLAVHQMKFESEKRIRIFCHVYSLGYSLDPGSLGAVGRQLVSYGAAAVPALIDASKDQNKFVQLRAASTLGQIEDPAAITALINGLKDGSVLGRLGALGALSRIGPDAKEAVPIVIQVMVNEQEQEDVRAAAARALGEIGDPVALPYLREVIFFRVSFGADPLHHTAFIESFRKLTARAREQKVSSPGSLWAGMVSLVVATVSGAASYLSGSHGLGTISYLACGVGLYGLASMLQFFYQALMIRGQDVAKVVNGKLVIDQPRFKTLPAWLQRSTLRHEKMHLKGHGEFIAYLAQAIFLPVDVAKGLFEFRFSLKGLLTAHAGVAILTTFFLSLGWLPWLGVVPVDVPYRMFLAWTAAVSSLGLYGAFKAPLYKKPLALAARLALALSSAFFLFDSRVPMRLLLWQGVYGGTNNLQIERAFIKGLKGYGPAVIPMLLKLAGNQGENYDLRGRAIDALVGNDDLTFPILFQALEGKDMEAHEAAQIVLYLRLFRYSPKDIPDPVRQEVIKLMNLAKDNDPAVRIRAVEALGSLGPGVIVAMPVLLERLRDTEPDVRIMTLWALRSTGTSPIETFSDPNESVRTVAIGIGWDGRGFMNSKARECIVEVMERVFELEKREQKTSTQGSFWAGIASLAAAYFSPLGSLGFGRFVPDLASFLMGGFGIYALVAAFNFFYQAVLIRGSGDTPPIAAYVPGQGGKPGKITVDEARFSKLPSFWRHSILRHERVHRFLHEKLDLTAPLINEIAAYFIQAIFLPFDFRDGLLEDSPKSFSTDFVKKFFSPLWVFVYSLSWTGAFYLWEALGNSGLFVRERVMTPEEAFDAIPALVFGEQVITLSNGIPGKPGMVGEPFTTPMNNLKISLLVWPAMVLFMFAYGWLRAWALNRGGPSAKAAPSTKKLAPARQPVVIPVTHYRTYEIGVMLRDALRLAEPDEAVQAFGPQA